MLPAFSTFAISAALLSLSDASPLALAPRDQDLKTFTNYRADLGETFTYFAPNWPTCGNDHTMTDLNMWTTIDVNVRPDCDTVIDSICSAAVKEASRPGQMRSLTAKSGTCQGFILFSQRTLADPLDYDICVGNFQSITKTCMLIGEGKNYASDKHQAGVQNVFHNPKQTPPSTYTWTAATNWNLYPGYMMGPPGYFGDISNVIDAGSIKPDGSYTSG
ncbi:hypothetical protein ACLMJK_001074 [Lecanora helva]